MCSSPITIPNPYYKGVSVKSKVDLHFRDSKVTFNRLHDTVNAYIQVPCGQCLQCISLRQSYINQRIQMESLRSELFMVTLTYDNDSLPIINVGEYCLAFPLWSDIQNMFKRLRKVLPHPIRYVMVSEYSKRRRPHFHGIIAVEREDIKKFYRSSVSLCEAHLSKLFRKEWRINVGSSRVPIYKPLFIYCRRGRKCNFDFHHIVNIPGHENDVTFYVSKYITKHDSTIHSLMTKIKLDNEISPEFTSVLLSALKPRCTVSKDFGDYSYPPIRDYINRCIMKDETSLPQFYDIYTGQKSLLSRYYRKHCETMNNALTRFYNSPTGDPFSNHLELNGTSLDWIHTSDKFLDSVSKLRKIKYQINKHNQD